ncbi:alpha-L-arabinofuranosidase [Rhypophila decipiens]
MAIPPVWRSILLLASVLLPILTSASPCDIYAQGGTPCVAAHSTTRALYSSYSGPLYQVRRGSDNTTTVISPLSVGGVANAASQDTFCAGTTCLITIIYDQSSRGNHLTQGPPGGFRGPDANGYDNLASAIGAPVTVGGKKAYGVFISPGTGYRNNVGSGIARGDAAEGMYAVLDGTHFNSGCCFDYGNAETSNKDTGNGHMEAIYFGNNQDWGSGAGSGPWLMADLENGLFSGQGSKNNGGDPSISYTFFTAIVKGQPGQWALRGGDSVSGGLNTYYNGRRPSASGYNPMKKEGSIILGIGGDNSISAQGTLYEGAMTSGYPSDATENAVHADVVAAGYAVGHMTSGPSYTTTPGYDARYLAHSGSTVNTQVVSDSSPTRLKQAASWTVRTGFANPACFSFESRDTLGSYPRHYNFVLQLAPNDGSKAYKEDSTFCPQVGLAGQATSSVRAWNYPTCWIRHYNNWYGGRERSALTAPMLSDIPSGSSRAVITAAGANMAANLVPNDGRDWDPT